MMKRILIFLVIVSLSMGLNAQTKGEIINIKTGDNLAKIVDSQQYLLPEFKDGRVIYKDKVAGGKLNYNILVNEVQFMQDGKVLALANQDKIHSVIIDGHTLINVKKGFAEVVMQKGMVQFVVQKHMTIKNPPKKGAYGVRDETAAINSLADIDTNRGMMDLSTESILLMQETYYLITGDKNQIANKKGYLKVFSKKDTKQIEEYIKDNKIDFSNEDQLKQLFTYCVDLPVK